MVDNKLPASIDSKYQHPVRGIGIEVAAEVVEEFGLPGDRYITTFEKNSITLRFQRSDDAVFCALKFQ
jgi:hypothetical protein